MLSQTFWYFIERKVKFHVPSLGEGKDPPYCKVAWKYLAPTLSGERKKLVDKLKLILKTKDIETSSD